MRLTERGILQWWPWHSISRIYATKPANGVMLNFSDSVTIAGNTCVSGSLLGISPLFEIDERSKTKSRPFKDETAF
jgi:hypothetical protein